MRCPCFKEEYVGFCETSGSLHVPSITEMERHCFSRGYRLCPLFRSDSQEEELRKDRDGFAGVKHLEPLSPFGRKVKEEISVEEELVAAGSHTGEHYRS